ncbi:phage major capsid protein [Halomonas ramblicola]|uniref:phage major capsid protein n=1 Tax=Halomonas ramblicola TaxID=747349 RepID=UPI0025B3D7B2|nr:phage major capsid protein [Halomonas ramblicola]MDN3520016.1 phage major capsid protein [Halomonas ramblicola]
MVNVVEQYQKTQDNLKQLDVDLKAFGDDMKHFTGEVKQTVAEANARIHALEQAVADGGGGITPPGMGGPASLGSIVLSDAESNSAFQSLEQWNQGTCRLKATAPIKAALTHDDPTNTMPSNPERGAIVPQGGRRRLRLLDVLPSRPTGSDAVEFVQLNASGDADEQEAEGDTKAEITFDGELKRCEIATVAGHTTVSRQVLSDHAALQRAIDQVIRYKLLSKLEDMIINGGSASSSGGKIVGLANDSSAFVPTITAGGPAADIIGESLVRQADAGYMPNLVLMNSIDWFALQITKNPDNEYLFGSPTMPVDEALWNQVIIPSASVPQDVAYTIDTNFVSVLDREQPTIMLSNSHADYMTRNLLLILGELRAGLEVTDTFAVYKIDLTTSGA